MTLRLPLSLSALLLLSASCAALVDSRDRTSTYQDLRADQERNPKDPHNYLDPTIGATRPAPPPSGASKPCQRQCSPGLHCDASGPVERCVPDAPAK